MLASGIHALLSAPPGGVFGHKGVYLITSDPYQVRQISYHGRQTSYQLRTNVWEENDGQGLHDIPYTSVAKSPKITLESAEL